MTKEEKRLLIKDLCARLPYNVIIRCTDSDTDYKCFLTVDILNELLNNTEYYDYKPYLRPMSSMTKEEFDEYMRFIKHSWEGIDKEEDDYYIKVKDRDIYTDWLLSHHFDYRGLIPMGLALEAPEGMYK